MGLPSPNLVFYFPLLAQNFSSWGGSRYWTMIASPVPDMAGGREQSVWFRFQQLQCAGKAMAPPCALHGKPQYYDSACAARARALHAPKRLRLVLLLPRLLLSPISRRGDANLSAISCQSPVEGKRPTPRCARAPGRPSSFASSPPRPTRLSLLALCPLHAPPASLRPAPPRSRLAHPSRPSRRAHHDASAHSARTHRVPQPTGTRTRPSRRAGSGPS